jgi:peptidylprolyl isomerase
MAHSAPQCTDLCAVSRKDFFKFSVAGAVAACTVAVPSSGLAVEVRGALLACAGQHIFFLIHEVLPSLPQELITASGLKIKKVKNGSGEKCEPGDLAAIRFRGKYKDFVFDDIFETPEPLYVRAGGAFLVKGMDEAMTMMRIGDYWELTLPGDLAFGDKGRPPSPGKPR